jgi:hypothetical protein
MSQFRNILLLLLGLTVMMTMLLSCIRIIRPEDTLRSKGVCDSCNIVAVRLFDKWQWEDRDDKHLDSVISIINYALPRCHDEQSKYEMSLIKLSSLCELNEYNKAFDFFDSIKFDDFEYSCYKRVIFNRIHAMERQSVEDITERNHYLQGTVDLLHDYLSENSVGVDSIWLNQNESTRDSLWLATFQYYHYYSILKGYKNAIKELDSLYNNHLMNEYCHDRLVNESENAQLKLFLGI